MSQAEWSRKSNPPAPWELGEKIPWDNPEFSQRMLVQHLSQEHDWASRRSTIIDQQVGWLVRHLPEAPSRILDLGCGPGLYTQRLARFGHACTGIDFSPASMAYAREQAKAEGISIDYRLADLRHGGFPDSFDLAMLLFGELNVFRPTEAAAILADAVQSLKPGGRLLVELHPFAEVQRLGQLPPVRQANDSGLFSARPHLYLQEHFWDATSATATTRYLVVDAETSEAREYGATMQAYEDEECRRILEHAGLKGLRKLDPAEWPVGEIFAGRLEAWTGIRQA